MFFERRTARGPPSRKKRCRPSPLNRATAIRRRRLSQPPRRFLLRRDPPWHPPLVNIHRYRVRAIQEYRNLSFPAPIRGNLVLLADDASVPGYAHDRPMEFRLMEQHRACFLLRTASFFISHLGDEARTSSTDYYFIIRSK